MINIDTNILARAFLSDEKTQTSKTQALIRTAADNKNLFISSYALLEFVWVLKTKKFTRQEIYDAIITLIDAAGITFGQREVILYAAEKYLKGKADFADYMIMAEGERWGSHQLKTFDQKLLKESKNASLP